MDQIQKIELIVCDWEGCISEPGGGTVPFDTPAVAELALLINRLRATPGAPAFVLCSGRQFPYGEAALQAINAFWYQRPSVFENGAGLYYPTTKHVRWNPLITPETARAMTEVRAATAEIVLETGGERELGKEYCISLNPPPAMTIEQFFAMASERLSRFVAGGLIEMTHSKSAVDITPCGVNKGSGVRFLAEATGIPLRNMVGIGDTAGDLPMLREVGHPACPANGDAAVREVAEYVSPRRTTRGVIDIVRHFVELPV